MKCILQTYQIAVHWRIIVAGIMSTKLNIIFNTSDSLYGAPLTEVLMLFYWRILITVEHSAAFRRNITARHAYSGLPFSVHYT